MTAHQTPTGQPQQPAWFDPAPTTVTGTAVPAGTGAVRRTARTVSVKIVAVIGVVAFLLGVGLAMLAGPLLGGGPGGPGGQGGPPGTSQQTGTGTSSGTTSS